MLKLLPAVVLLASFVPAHADTITTFTLDNVTTDDGATVTGTYNIDTTTGVFTGYASYTLNGSTIVFDQNPYLFSANGFEDVSLSDNALGYFFLGLELPVDTLVGYTGGPICGGAHVCSYEVTLGSTSYLEYLSSVEAEDSDFYPEDILETGSLVAATSATPEPGSFLLLTTGLIGIASVWKRRLQA